MYIVGIIEAAWRLVARQLIDLTAFKLLPELQSANRTHASFDREDGFPGAW